MNPVHHVDLGRNWRGQAAAARRLPGQRWGLPAAVGVLAVFAAAAGVSALVVGTLDSAVVLVLALIVPSAAAAAAALAVSAVRGNGPVVDFGLPTSWDELAAQLRAGLTYGAAAVVGGLALAAVLLALAPWAQESPLVGLVSLPPALLAVLVAWVVVGAPVCEELMFRGMLWGALEKRARLGGAGARLLTRPWVPCLLTALVFAVAHLEWWRLPILVYSGFMLGMARMRTGSAAASALAHSLNNLLPALALLALAGGG